MLTVDEIVGAGLRIVDTDGLSKLSMRSLANALHCDPMAVYRHVGGREDLLARIAARVLDEVTPPACTLGTRAWLRQLAENVRSSLHQHPNAVVLIGHSQLSGGSTLHLIDQLVERLIKALPDKTGTHGGLLADRVNALIGGLVGYVTVELSPLPDRAVAPPIGEYPALLSHADELDGAIFALRSTQPAVVALPGGYRLLTEALIDAVLSPGPASPPMSEPTP